MKPFNYVRLLLLVFITSLSLSGQALAQPTITQLEIKKGNFDYAPDNVEVPLNAFQLVFTFDQNVLAPDMQSIKTPKKAADMLVLRSSASDTAPDLLEEAAINSVTSTSGDAVITVDVLLPEDLLANHTYTLTLDETQVISGVDGQSAQPYSIQFTTAPAVTTIAGVADSAELCQGETTELSPIMLGESARYGFVPQTNGVLELTLSNPLSFEFTGTQAQVSVLGGNGMTASVTQQTSTHLSIEYDMGSDLNTSNSILISGLKVKFTASADATTDIIVDNTAGRYNINGLYPGNASVILGTVAGKVSSILDNRLDAGAVSGPTSVCLGASAVYTVPSIGAATFYQWTIPTGFTPQGLVTHLGGNQWQTTQNFITLEANATGAQTISVKATNSCREGSPSTPFNITVQSLTPVTALQFKTPALNAFGDGTTQNIPITAGPQNITLEMPASGTIAFAGPGIIDQTFYPSIVTPGTNTINYTFTNDLGCLTTGSFTFNVLDIGNVVTDLASNYCDNQTTEQEFKVKLMANGVAITPSNIQLTQTAPANSTISPSLAPYNTGFGFKVATATDHVLVLRPDVLGAGIYELKVTIGADEVIKTFDIHAAPNPAIAGNTTICAGTTSTYNVTPTSNHSYAWSLSGGGNPTSSNGSSITIDWAAATTTQTYTLSLTETNLATSCAQTVQQTITVQALPNPEIEGPLEACAHSIQQYQIKGGTVAGHTYQWEVVEGIIVAETTNQITVVWGDATTGQVRLTATNPQTCQASTTQPVTIHPLPAPVFVTANDEICANSENVTYQVTATNNTNMLQWEVVGGTIVGGTPGDTSKLANVGQEQIEINWSDGSQGYIRVTEVSTQGCKGIISKAIQINPLPILTFSGMVSQYCNDSPVVTLSPTVNGAPPALPANGQFVVRDAANTSDVLVLTNNDFSPNDLFQLQGAGQYQMVFRYTDVRHCSNTSTPFPFRIEKATLTTEIQFTSAALGTFSGSGSTQNIANVLDPQTITVVTPTPQTVVFSGPGMVGNTFYPGFANLGPNVIEYVFTNTKGCTTRGNFVLDVFDASVTIDGLLSNYCDSETSNQEFKVKTSINGLPITPGDIQLTLTSPITTISPSPAPFGTGFGLKTTTSTDHIMVIRPDILGPGDYQITVVVGLSSITQNFRVNPTPDPLISGDAVVCANTTSTYQVPPNNAHTYAWNLSGGGKPLTGNGSAITITWEPATATQTYQLTLTETNISTGCNRTVVKIITVNPQPIPEIEGPQKICANSIQQYSVKGGATTGHVYDWSVAGGVITNLGADQITVVWGSTATGVVQLTERNVQGCIANVSQVITIFPISVPTAISGEDELCANSEGEMYTVTAANPNNRLIWEVDGGTIVGTGTNSVSGIGLQTIEVNWGNGSQGNITVTEVNANDCEGVFRKVIKINPLPRLAFSGFNRQFCNNSSTVTLSPTVNGLPPAIPTNARFVVMDTTNSQELYVLPSEVFFPQELFQRQGRGKYHLVFEYTDANGCFNSSVPFPFTLDNAPQDVQLTISQIEGRPRVAFNVTAANVATDWTWQWTWQWGDGFRSASTQQNDTLDLLSTQLQAVNYNLKLENSVKCDETIQRTFLIDFGVRGNVWQRPTQFTDSTDLGNNTIDSWHWDFGDGQESTQQNPSHTYQNVGTYQVVLTVRQGVIAYSLQKQVNIFPLVVVTPDQPYKADFETGKADWINDGAIQQAGQSVLKNSWALRSLNANQHITGSPNNRVWITDKRTNPALSDSSARFFDNEQSHVESPFFDIAALDRPLLRFRYWSDTDESSDGAVLLYTIDDGKTWQRLGDIGDGIHWYGHSRILGNPGKRSGTDTQPANKNWVGWSGNAQTTDTSSSYSGWQIARLSLEAVQKQMIAQGASQIRFRLAFGSNGDSPVEGLFEGFAFDDFEVLNQNRMVLWEYFGNQSQPEEGKIARDSAKVNPQAISIHYHLGFPANDVINDQNPHDHSGRTFYYGIRDAARLAIDGEALDTVRWETWATQRYGERILRNSPFEIAINRPTTSQTTLSVSATITALENFNRSVILQVVVIDTAVTVDGNIFYNVMRKMLPDAAGTFRANAWAKGETQTLEFDWDYGDLDPSGFKVVVFVQDYDNKEVYQAQITRQTVNQRPQGGGEITSLKPIPNSLPLQVFPNPVTKVLKVNLPLRSHSGKVLRWQVVALNGQTLQTGNWQYIKNEPLSLDLTGLAQGVYLLQIINDGQVYSRRVEKR